MTDTQPRFFSLERKLPILIGSLVASALVITLLSVRYELRANAADGARERLARVTDQLADLVNTSIDARFTLFADVAQAPAIVAFATGAQDDVDAVIRQLDRLRAQSRADSLLPLQLRTVDGRVIDERPEHTRARVAGELPPVPDVALADSVQYSPLQPSADGLTYWTSAPVRANGRIVGHIVQQRAVRGSNAGEQIEGLLGSDIEIYFGNIGSPQWIALESGNVVQAPPIAAPLTPAAYEFGGRDMYAFAAPLRPSPWVVIAQMPVDGIMARPDAVLRRLAAVSIVLLLLGGIAAWLVSRSVTRPLAQLGAAADALAAGDYSRRTQLRRADEIGRVARSFDAMADNIDESHEQLAHQFHEARSLARELENTNARLNDALRDADAARLEAQEANRAKSEFLATMSHEIRTPINAVIGYTDLMEVELPGPLNQTQREYVERIRLSAVHLTSLVNDVLDFAKVESGQMRVSYDRLLAHECAERAVAMLQNSAAARKIDIATDCPRPLAFIGDAQRVQQILLNLLSNSVKFTEPGGSVRISCVQRESRPADADSPSQRWTCIAVSDTGIGIAADQLERIFDPFVQGTSGYTRPHGGTGLGLAISRSLARMMDGDITVESQPGEGSTFTLWLPREPSTRPAVVNDTHVTN